MRPTRLRAMAFTPVLVTSLFGCAGVDAALAPATSSARDAAAGRDAAARPPVSPSTGSCRRERALALGAPAPVSLEALRATIGTRVDAPATRDLLARLGVWEVDRSRAPSATTTLWRFARHGIGLEIAGVAGAETVRGVQLLGSWPDPAFPGELPEGLDFRMTPAETFAVLGLPDEGGLRAFAWSPHHHGAHGLSVQFSHEGCLSVVGLERPLAPGTIAFDGIRVDEGHVERGLTGLAVRFERTVGAMPAPVEMILGVELVDEHDRPVRGFSGPADAPVGIEVRTDAASRSDGHVFIPYVAMDLEPGPHRLRGRIRARVAGADGPRELPAAAPATFEVAFEMPEIVAVRVGAREAVAAPGVWDGGPTLPEPLDHYDRPDLRFHVSWSTVREGQAAFGSFTSTSGSNAFEARWSELSPAFLLAPQDTFLLCVEDEETVTFAEEVGCVRLTAASAKVHAEKATPLRDRRLVRLVLARPRITRARAER